MNDKESILKGIAWDGSTLGGPESLPDDLTFRRALTAAFSPEKPLRRRTICSLIKGRGFTRAERSKPARGGASLYFSELLDSAIASVLRDPDFDNKVSSASQAAPQSLANSAAGGIRTGDFGKEKVWAARSLVFEQLVADEDFGQFFKECYQEKAWWLRIWELGEHLPKVEDKPKPSGAPVATAIASVREYSRSGSVWEGLFAPFMKALAYAVPLAVTAGAVGVYVIDKQAEIRFSPTVENHISPSEAAHIDESINTLAQAVISQGSDNRTALEVIDESNQSIQALQAQLSDIKLLLVNPPSEEEKNIHLTFDQDFKSLWADGLAIKSPITLYLGNAPKLHVQSTDKSSEDSNPPHVPSTDTGSTQPTAPHTAPPPSNTLSATTLPLQNPPSTSPTPTKSEWDDAFRTNLKIEEVNLNLRTAEQLGGIVLPEKDDSFGKTELLEFGKLLTKVPVMLPEPEKPKGGQPTPKSSNVQEPKQSPPVLYLCDWTIPPEFLLMVADKTLNTIANCSVDTTQGQKLLIFTKTPQYVPELKAFVSLDDTSGKRYFLFGGRRVVLRLIPVTPTAHQN